MSVSKAHDISAPISVNQAVEGLENSWNDAKEIVSDAIEKLNDPAAKEEGRNAYELVDACLSGEGEDALNFKQSLGEKYRALDLADMISAGFQNIGDALEDDDKAIFSARDRLERVLKSGHKLTEDPPEMTNHIEAEERLKTLINDVVGIKIGFLDTFDEPPSPHEITGKDGTVYHVAPAE